MRSKARCGIWRAPNELLSLLLLCILCTHAEELQEITSIDKLLKECSRSSEAQLVCSNRNINKIELDFNQLSEKVYLLDLDYNKITDLTESTFAQGYQKLVELSLANNRLFNIHKETFNSLNSLERLDLSNNNLKTIDPQIFSKLSKLSILNLANNDLLYMHQSECFFSEIAPLRLLDLSSNFQLLQSAPENGQLLCKDVNLGKLSLANNGLKSLNSDFFAKFASKLQAIDLSGNLFEKLPTDTLRKFTTLEKLIVNDLPYLYSINYVQLSGLSSLRSVQISRAARLRSIGQYAFSDCSQLNHVIISQNPKLTRLEPTAFLASSSGKYYGQPMLPSRNRARILSLGTKLPLKELRLQFNSLVSLNKQMIDFDKLEILDISGNPLRCECGLNFVLNLKSLRNINQTICAKPRRFENQNIIEVAQQSGSNNRLELQCLRIFDRDNDVVWGLFTLLASCFTLVLFVFAVLSVRVRQTVLNTSHSCFKWLGLRRSWRTCFDCCGLLQSKGKYSSFTNQQRQALRAEQTDAATRVRADLEWDDEELDL